jgi:hypothetical protein
MGAPQTLKAASADAENRLRSEQLGRQLYFHYKARNARRQRLAAHLHRCGARPVLEALVAVELGQQLDDVLDSFARIPVRIYHALGANELPIHALTVIDGGHT